MASDFDEKKSNRVLGLSDGGDNSWNGMRAPDADVGETYDGGVTKNGLRLHPQPTADPLDPVNWSSFKKHTILAIVMLK